MKSASLPQKRRYSLLARPQIWLAVFLLALSSCKPSIALYDADTFARTTELKAKTLVLMDRAVEPYAEYKKQVDDVMAQAWSLYDRQKARHHNALSVKQWELLLLDNAQPGTKAMLPAFFDNWKTDGKLTNFYIQEKKKKIAEAFDEILKLEGAKLKEVQ